MPKRFLEYLTGCIHFFIPLLLIVEMHTQIAFGWLQNEIIKTPVQFNIKYAKRAEVHNFFNVNKRLINFPQKVSTIENSQWNNRSTDLRKFLYIQSSRVCSQRKKYSSNQCWPNQRKFLHIWLHLTIYEYVKYLLKIAYGENSVENNMSL